MTADTTKAAAADAAAFDWAEIEDVPTGEVRIKRPNGQPTSMVVQLAGPEHPDRRARAMQRQRKLRAEFSRTGRMPVSDPEDDEAEELDDLVANTLGWTGAAEPYTRAAARALYADPKRRWLRDQVKAALDERHRFTSGCATP